MTDQLSKNDFFVRTPFLHVPEWVPVAKWVRVKSGNAYVADSRRVMLKRTFPPVYYFPREDVREKFLEKSNENSKSDEWGKRIYYHVKTDSKTAENAAWSYENPTEQAPADLENFFAFEWKAMDTWLEEDEEVRVHPRDPYHRIDVCNSSRHVRIVASGETIAESHRPVLLFETGLPVRFYIPKTDVRMDLLVPSDYQSHCPYKGTASYYSIKADGDKVKNMVWTYPFPNAEVSKIKDLVAFYTENLDDVFIDGKQLPKMKTE